MSNPLPRVLLHGRTTGNANVAVQVDASGIVQTATTGGGGGGDASAANQTLEIAAINKLNAQILDLDTGAGTANTAGLFLAIPGIGGPVAGGSTTNPVNVANGFSIKAYDYVSLAQASTTDTYTFKTGGSGGTTQATITITYTDSTKVTISTVVKT